MRSVARTAGELLQARGGIVGRGEREAHGRGLGDEACGEVVLLGEVEPA
jgi:hypothetical protein